MTSAVTSWSVLIGSSLTVPAGNVRTRAPPSTSSRCVGAFVPIPTLPSFWIANRGDHVTLPPAAPVAADCCTTNTSLPALAIPPMVSLTACSPPTRKSSLVPWVAFHLTLNRPVPSLVDMTTSLEVPARRRDSSGSIVPWTVPPSRTSTAPPWSTSRAARGVVVPIPNAPASVTTTSLPAAAARRAYTYVSVGSFCHSLKSATATLRRFPLASAVTISSSGAAPSTSPAGRSPTWTRPYAYNRLVAGELAPTLTVPPSRWRLSCDGEEPVYRWISLSSISSTFDPRTIRRAPPLPVAVASGAPSIVRGAPGLVVPIPIRPASVTTTLLPAASARRAYTYVSEALFCHSLKSPTGVRRRYPVGVTVTMSSSGAEPSTSPAGRLNARISL